MLPDHTTKLRARWQGPSRIWRKVGPINYELELLGAWKSRQMCHVNMLKWCETQETYLMDPQEVLEEWGYESMGNRDGSRPTPVLGEQLPCEGWEQFECLVQEYRDVFTEEPG